MISSLSLRRVVVLSLSSFLFLAATRTGMGQVARAIEQAPPVPAMISYQGYLTDTTGSPVTAVKSMVFAIYRDSTTSSHVWTSTKSVSIDEGLFNVYLGMQNPLPDSIFTGQLLFLGVAVDSDPEMKPRQLLVSTPYSFLAGQADCAPTIWYTDADGDGFGVVTPDSLSCTQPDGFAPNMADCNDDEELAYPGAEDVCSDGIDSDCNGFDGPGPDTDADGVSNTCDVCPAGNDLVNSDTDTIPDDCDNCPAVDNEFQEDQDADGIGDLCDTCTDTDLDGWGDPGFDASTCPLGANDGCPNDFDPDQLDTDADATGDACDTDDDNDGVLDVEDDCPLVVGDPSNNGCPL